ncbi:Cobalt uptake substrate-specific transmembrane region [Halomicronema hongdechloris C2206]|uniref:Cobalt uptake substrate-specific transmembrane region n=1 Tax=Halomicronema hongdechloris C2206 TaxID=1641165 RepID=A0A1Z3HLG1_9CYAN|nr:cobalt transporter CbiM [Halomicronema hongdechloris]ASC71128.1 Cobalt uptake substrate-specific transmembrane region [Halomicronema hongdechloris C2206]
MHIPDGILPAQVCAGGYAMTGLATWYALRQINHKPDPTAEIPKGALLTAAFFVASSIYIPIPPASVHLILNGLLGVMLGYFAFPAILIGLFFQAIVLGHGGLTTLGVNAVMMGIPAVLAYHLFRLHDHFDRRLPARWSLAIFAFLGGGLGLGITALSFFTLVVATVPADFDSAAEKTAIVGLLLTHLPLIGIEGVFTALLVLFLQRVKPELLKESP